ncbi:MAG TPA: spheroidene monooxygenase [Acidimicrobiia bacterium]|jgi:hypothetical protein
MIASVHLADVGVGKGLAAQPRTPKPARVPGLRSARIGFGAPLGSGLLPKPDFGRLAMVTFWDDDAALDRFVDSDSLARTFARGWSVRLAPLRAHGTWPGLDAGIPVSRKSEYDGPVAVITLGRLRISQGVRFLRASAKAEAAVLAAPGLIFATGFGSPPIVSTISLWESPSAVAAYAYDVAGTPHPGAIREGRQKPFHKQEAFIRFRPYASSGSLGGKNPLAGDWMERAGVA